MWKLGLLFKAIWDVTGTGQKDTCQVSPVLDIFFVDEQLPHRILRTENTTWIR